jgi:hypothetical protein
MASLLELREQHGNVFVSNLPDGQSIPWKPLTLGDYIQYDRLIKVGLYPAAYIENEIFKKCVLDPVLVDNIDQLRAGVVSTVSTAILSYSGPQSIDELTTLLNINRNEANQALHQLVSTVCQAFPAYKPEDVYDLEYNIFMLRVAQAEEKLMRAGLMTEPISIAVPGQDSEKKKKRPKPPQVDLKKRYEDEGIVPTREEYLEDKQEKARDRKAELRKVEMPVTPPPTPPPTTERTVISKADIIEHQQVMSGHDVDPVAHKKAADETAKLYQDYLQELADGKELRIRTPEERKAAAEERSKEHKKKLLAQRDQLMKDMAKERKELLKVREKARERKRRRAANKRR